MPILKENLVSRIRKLTKPATAQQALQPVLEAISNAVMAIDEKYENPTEGRVEVVIDRLGSDDVTVSIRDDGVGLDEAHFEAFLEIDTEFKRKLGGKGVGRLYWLDAFASIEVESQYKSEAGDFARRAFKFVLDAEEQVQFVAPMETWHAGQTGTIVKLRGLRNTYYQATFPKQSAMVVNHTISEFIASFLSKKSPIIELNITLESGVQSSNTFPEDVASLVHYGPQTIGPVEIEGRGTFDVQIFLCDRRASRGMQLKHALHLLGDGRAVTNRKIDDLLGISDLSHDGVDDLRLHVVVASEYLDQRTVESRTSFSIPEADLGEITKAIVERVREDAFEEQFKKWDQDRKRAFEQFLDDQPIYAFGDPDVLFEQKIPKNATSPEQFVSSLSIERMRREIEREKVLTGLVNGLVSGDEIPENFSKLVSDAASQIQVNERSALAHHAARRKIVLDMLDQLIRRVRQVDPELEETHHLEETLHSLLVPMRMRGDNPRTLEKSSHDLWILDERLTFTAGFSSDLQLRKVVEESTSKDRPDILLWNIGFGLAPIEEPYGDAEVDDTQPLSRIFIVELKRPGRTRYSAAESIEQQVMKYVRELNEGKIEGFGRRKIRVSKDCQFYCLVVADIDGDLKDQLFGATEIDNGTGRRIEKSAARTVIDIVEWSHLLSSARDRNRALISMAGLHLKSQPISKA